MRCAACLAEILEATRYCDACGAAIYQRARVAPGPSAADALAPPRRRWGAWLWLPLGAAVTGGAMVLTSVASPSPTDTALRAALHAAAAQGEGPGRDPICVANGLSYDAEAVNVQFDNAGTLAWMDTLVAAGLYKAPVDGQSGGLLSQPIRVYQPAPELAAWNGVRRLCVARAVKLEGVRNIGSVEPMRLRGVAYRGVAADVVWTLDDAAPWLAAPGVAAAFVSELPTWRGARWQVAPDGWRLVQRKHFFLHGSQWRTGESLERLAGMPPRAPPVP